MSKKKSTIKSCVILNPPQTTEEKKRSAKALAWTLYRALSIEEFEILIQELKQEQEERSGAACQVSSIV